MHFIDRVARLARDCAQLADQCADDRLASEIATLARELLQAASDEAAIETVRDSRLNLPEPTMIPDSY